MGLTDCFSFMVMTENRVKQALTFDDHFRQANLEETMEDKQLVSILSGFKEEIIEAFDRRIGIVEESVQHKLNLVVEGQQLLVERIDRLEVGLKEEIHKVDQRVTTAAADLSAHRRGTEAHHGVYCVKED